MSTCVCIQIQCHASLSWSALPQDAERWWVLLFSPVSSLQHPGVWKEHHSQTLLLAYLDLNLLNNVLTVTLIRSLWCSVVLPITLISCDYSVLAKVRHTDYQIEYSSSGWSMWQIHRGGMDSHVFTHTHTALWKLSRALRHSVRALQWTLAAIQAYKHTHTHTLNSTSLSNFQRKLNCSLAHLNASNSKGHLFIFEQQVSD